MSSRSSVPVPFVELPNPIPKDYVLKDGEGYHLEFKEGIYLGNNKAFTEQIVKTYIAFRNFEGGTLLAGVKDNGHVKGILLPKNKGNVQDLIRTKIRNLTSDDEQNTMAIKFVPIENTKEVVICFHIYPTDGSFVKPKNYKGSTWVREGSQSVSMDLSEQENFVSTFQKTFRVGKVQHARYSYLSSRLAEASKERESLRARIQQLEEQLKDQGKDQDGAIENLEASLKQQKTESQKRISQLQKQLTNKQKELESLYIDFNQQSIRMQVIQLQLDQKTKDHEKEIKELETKEKDKDTRIAELEKLLKKEQDEKKSLESVLKGQIGSWFQFTNQEQDKKLDPFLSISNLVSAFNQ